jgi:malate dehydrogenase (oxaloacetate-decarboxylating)
MDDWKIFPQVAAAVGMRAQKEKVAGRKMTKDALFNQAADMIKRSRGVTQTMMQKGYIKKFK